jgi:hypothetical protein
MLTTKRRLMIFLLLLIMGGLSVFSIVAARILNLGSNVQDPLYFSKLTSSKFLYNNGTQILDFQFDSVPLNATHYQAHITYGSTAINYNVTSDGRFIDQGRITNNYSIFWVHIIEPGSGGSEFGKNIGRTFHIFDNIGILGENNTEYILTITAGTVYWPLEASLLGAQASLTFEVRSLAGVLIATGVMDLTCGMVFQLNIGTSGLRTFELIDTSYDISRNRLTGLPMVIISIIAAPCLAFLYLHYRKKEELSLTLETTFLVAAGGLVLLVDFYIDIWMYAPLGLAGNLLLHAGIVGIFAAFCIWKQYGLKWVIPGILEIAYVGVIVLATGDSYVPHLTAFMGLTITWLVMLYASGIPHPQSKSKLGKLVSNIV